MGATATIYKRGVHDRPVRSRRSAVHADGLTPEEFGLLGQVFEQEHDFIDHPRLHEKGIEQELFGQDPQVRPSTTRNPGAGHEAPSRFLKMTPEEEERAFLRYNLARLRMVRLLRRQAGAGSLDLTIGRELAKWYRRVLEVRSEIVNANFPLVMAMAKRSRFASLDINEMISEGNMALLRSINKYDLRRRYRFSSYACRSILKAFSRVALRIGRYRHHFPTEYDEALEQTDHMEQRRDEQREHFLDVLQAVLTKNSAHLNETERLVIKERFAIQTGDGGKSEPKTLGEVGDMVGLTKERVRQIQNRALEKLRAAMRNRFAAA